MAAEANVISLHGSSYSVVDVGKEKGTFKEEWRRSVAKSVTYRILVMVLDFSVIYLLTGKSEIAFGFMVVSNLYTTVAYYVHERAWDRVNWGKAPLPFKRSHSV